jgi:hypothetical protein
MKRRLLLVIGWLAVVSPARADALFTTVSGELVNLRYGNLFGILDHVAIAPWHPNFEAVQFQVGPDWVGVTQRIEGAALTDNPFTTFQPWEEGSEPLTGESDGVTFRFDQVDGYFGFTSLAYEDLFITGQHPPVSYEQPGIPSGDSPLPFSVVSNFTPPDGLTFIGTPYSWFAIEFELDYWEWTETSHGYEPVTAGFTTRWYAVPEPSTLLLIVGMMCVGLIRSSRRRVLP